MPVTEQEANADRVDVVVVVLETLDELECVAVVLRDCVGVGSRLAVRMVDTDRVDVNRDVPVAVDETD